MLTHSMHRQFMLTLDIMSSGMVLVILLSYDRLLPYMQCAKTVELRTRSSSSHTHIPPHLHTHTQHNQLITLLSISLPLGSSYQAPRQS